MVTGNLVGGRYRLLQLVGTGGMATVYRAHDERLKHDVAVKVIARALARDPLFVRRFRREAELAARLAHPNVVAVLDAGSDPTDFIVMELVDGVDAGTLLRRRRPLTAEETVDIIVQICDALAYVHDQDVVHHDVTPRNILVGRLDRTAKLADFGLASRISGGPAAELANLPGTAGYIAPEILHGARPSPLWDLYALGVVTYRLLAGPSGLRSYESEATAPHPAAARRMSPLAASRPDLSPRLIDAVQQAAADDPDARQRSVAQFRAQLLAARGARRDAIRAEQLARAA